MNSISFLSSGLVLIGAGFMLAAIVLGGKARSDVPAELRKRWRVITALMIFFLFGYLLFIVILIGDFRLPTELVTGVVFFGGALFVLLVIKLSRITVQRMKLAEKKLLNVNEDLEQRVVERTREIESSREFLKTILDSLNDEVLIINAGDYRISGANASFLKARCEKEQNIIGKTCYEVTHHRDEPCGPPDDVCPLGETVLSGGGCVVEHIHYGQGDAKAYVEVSTTPLRNGGGAIAQVVHVARDISKRKQAENMLLSMNEALERRVAERTAWLESEVQDRRRAEEKLRRYADELRESNDELHAFIFSAAHDLRAPVVNAWGFTSELTQILRENTLLLERCVVHLSEEERAGFEKALHDEVPKAVGFINTAVDRMGLLINAMLKLSGLIQQELSPGIIDVNNLVRVLLEAQAVRLSQKNVAVTVGTLPAVVADRTAFEQIMEHLLDNSVKYLEPGRRGEIRITGEQNDQEAVFHIHDNGRGVSKEDTHKIFRMFRRAGKQDVPGEGMGLAYVKTLVHRHGGRVWCESEPGMGSAFSFSIPAVAAEAGLPMREKHPSDERMP